MSLKFRVKFHSGKAWPGEFIKELCHSLDGAKEVQVEKKPSETGGCEARATAGPQLLVQLHAPPRPRLASGLGEKARQISYETGTLQSSSGKWPLSSNAKAPDPASSLSLPMNQVTDLFSLAVRKLRA